MRHWNERGGLTVLTWLGVALLALAGTASAQRLSLEILQQQINAKVGLSDLPGCGTNDTAVRHIGVWKCKSTLPRFLDNGDGTVTDNKTGLMWEKKETCGNAADYSQPHCWRNVYTWSAASPFTAPTGTLYSDFLAKLNLNSTDDPTKTCFANHCDWRIPTIVELSTINNGSGNGEVPTIDPIFGPTWADYYWSSSSLANDPSYTWGVVFRNSGFAASVPKSNPIHYARAVRGS